MTKPLQTAAAVPVRDIPLATMNKWIDEDERDAARFWDKAGHVIGFERLNYPGAAAEPVRVLFESVGAAESVA